MSAAQFDVTTDFQEDSDRRDPDVYSRLLQGYHQRLWTKRLPGGAMFTLSAERVGSARVLRHSSELGEFVMSSDTLANSNRGRLRTYYEQMGEESNVAWHHDCGTIGGRLIFPRNRIDGRQTINQRRGTHARIRDRFDLTLEAIRRHYSGEESPLSFTLSSYASFFALFETFRGYVDFFLLQDLVDDRGEVRFYLPFDTYESSPFPSSLEQYREFRQRQLEFVAARNARMAHAWAADPPG